MDSLLTEVMLAHPRQSLGKFQLDWMPQPGHYLDIYDQTYLVLERHHHYQYRAGQYCLHKISLHVQSATRPSEKSLLNGRWVVGEATCRFNAHSEMLRCAVNPEGPCQGCRFYEAS
ncbi:MAG: DUF6464 family protein [Cyanophyceae cyanobacterium]